MRDHLAHRSFDTDHAIVVDVVDHDLEPLAVAVRALIDRADGPEGGGPAASKHPPTP